MLLSLPKARLITFFKTRLMNFYLNSQLITDPIYLTWAQCAQRELLGLQCVHRASSVVNNFFKHHLLPNHCANLHQTLQECSLGGPLLNLYTYENLIPPKALVAMATKCSFQSISSKIFWTAGQILKEFYRNVPWMTLFKIVSKILICWKTWLWWMRLLVLYGHEEILKNSSPKLQVRSWNNFTEMFFGWSSSEIICKLLIRQKTCVWLWWMRASWNIWTRRNS